MNTRVLIVDDSMRWRLELRDLLLSHGFSVAGEASSGRRAIEMYDELQPDITMVDARMPDLDGVCTIREIRQHDPQAVLVVCAGSGEKGVAMEALSAGAADFCPKPYIPRRVVTMLRKVAVGISRR
jgi:two-component system, chemotaxis family, chemotaxis protein CheY